MSKILRKRNKACPGKLQQSGGYVLLETIFYVCFFAILSIAVIEALMVMGKSFKETSIQSELVLSSSIMERISREIRQANSINSISVSDLVLNTKDEAGNSKTVQFQLSNSNILLKENGSLIGNLNVSNISISNLNFTQINTLKGTGIKILLSLSANNDNLGRFVDFYDTIVLRGDY